MIDADGSGECSCAITAHGHKDISYSKLPEIGLLVLWGKMISILS